MSNIVNINNRMDRLPHVILISNRFHQLRADYGSDMFRAVIEHFLYNGTIPATTPNILMVHMRNMFSTFEKHKLQDVYKIVILGKAM